MEIGPLKLILKKCFFQLAIRDGCSIESSISVAFSDICVYVMKEVSLLQ